jgi:DNA-directed RNA polymerase subunit beta
MNANTGEIKEQTVFMGDFPMMTDKGTFIINGTERVVVSQLVRSPGVIFQPGERFRLRNLSKHQLVTGTIHPYRGEWIEFDVEQKPGKDVTAGTRVARKRRLSDVRAAAGPRLRRGERPGFLEASCALRLPRGPVGEGPRARPHPGRGAGRDLQAGPPRASRRRSSRPAYFRNAFFESRRYDLSRVGRYKLNRKLGPELDQARAVPDARARAPEEDQPVLSPLRGPRRVHLPAATWCNAEPGYRLDDQDHFANRRIRSVGELIQNQVRIGLSRMERVVRERMTTQDVEAITPQTLINIRPWSRPSRSSSGPPSCPVHGPGEPAVGPHPPPSPLGARPRWPVP